MADKKNIDIAVGNSKLKAYIILKSYKLRLSPVLVVSPNAEEAGLIKSTILTLISSRDTDRESPYINVLSRDREDKVFYRTALYRFLYNMLRYKNIISIIDHASLFMNLPGPLDVMEYCIELCQGKRLDRDEFLNQLFSYGYKRSDLVVSEGQYSSRGFITDIFIPLGDFPIRIEFDEEDRISSIRSFDHLSQRSIKSITETLLVPVSPIYGFYSPEYVKNASRAVNVASYAQSQKLAEMLEDMLNPDSTSEEFLSSLLYKSSIADYLTDETRIILDEKGDFNEIAAQTDSHSHQCTALEEGFIAESCQKLLKSITGNMLKQYHFSMNLVFQGHEDLHVESSYLENYHGNMDRFSDDVSSWSKKGNSILIALPSDKLISNLKGMLESKGIMAEVNGDWFEKSGVHIIKGELARGFMSDYFRVVFVSETEIFGHRFEKERDAKKRSLQDLSSVLSLKTGDFIIHSSYGIGRYAGIKTMDIDSNLIDFVEILYRDEDRLYIPVYNLGSIHRYASGDKDIALDKLKSARFSDRKKRIKEKLMAYASELLDLYAKRSLKKGYSFQRFSDYEEEFDSGFLYEETDDQYRTTHEIKQDMEKESPMDRVLIGDVGFGKTEVVMRAVYLAVLNNKQVAVLVPTTVLAQQHYITFMDRFKGTPVNIEMLSRFTDSGRENSILKSIKEKKADIVIGTHRLLSNDIEFCDLGLLVIDEEHRFGVKHKESLKFLKEEVDTITLTATPIPRTYYMSVSGLRDMSFISTPPKDRMSIKTSIIEKQDHLVRDAVLKELKRGGQVFFVHNRVQSIYSVGKWLSDILPEARIAVGHAQMRDSSLERVMLNFVERKYDILLCTTIIESGLDIPNANTILIDNADRLGLAQLYQLRGRVGRTNRQAYAYMIIKSKRKMTSDGKLRMQAIMNLSELGAGFQLAGYDLDIRGAGNLVGKEQSGHIEQLGIEFYTKMLQDTVEELRGNRISACGEVEIKLDKSSYIPPIYISDVSERFSFYKKLSGCQDYDSLEMVTEEMQDRFGPVPREVDNVILINRLRIKSSKKGIKGITGRGNLLVLSLYENNTLKLDALLKIVRQSSNKYQLKENQLIINIKDSSLESIIRECEFLYERIFQ